MSFLFVIKKKNKKKKEEQKLFGANVPVDFTNL